MHADAAIRLVRPGLACVLVGVSRLVCGGFILVSSIGHLANPYFFLASVLHYDLVRGGAAVLVAALIPFLELVIGAALIVGEGIPSTLVAASILMAIFASAQGISLARGLDISCGCFGVHSSEVIGALTVARTAGLMLLACIGAVGSVASERQRAQASQ
jgi:hypothetical protein